VGGVAESAQVDAGYQHHLWAPRRLDGADAPSIPGAAHERRYDAERRAHYRGPRARAT
jgi:hypothetical protein